MTFSDPPSLHFGEACRARRDALNLTQAELAARLDVTVQTVSNWECGRSVPWPHKQQTILMALQPARDRIIDRINGA